MNSAPKPREGRAFIGIHHTCCNVYSRAYVNAMRDAFEGNCPSCGRRVRLPIGKGGSSARFWSAS